MKEKFENRRLTGDINVACKYDDGSTRYWCTRKEEVVEHIVQTVNRYQQLGYRLTLRQLHYQLVTKNWIVNHDTAYKKLGNILDDCRYAGVIDWDSIVDRGRVPYIPYTVEDAVDALNDAVRTFRIDRQRDQTNVVELWTEKDALSEILKTSTEKYGVQLVVNKGYTSSSAIYEAYERIMEKIVDDDKTFTILYFGDHDPSGLDMVRDIRERLTFMAQHGQYSDIFGEYGSRDIDSALTILPIGLTMPQIKRYKLPANPTKMTDTRSDKYIAQYGKTCWEVDALDPTILTAIVESHIRHETDMGLYDEMLDTEGAERTKLNKLIDIAKNMKDDTED